MDFVQTAKKGALWLLAFLFVMQLSGCIVLFAFMDKFFDVGVYDRSLEKHGVYATMQASLLDMLTSSMPDEYKPQVKAEFEGALTQQYVRSQVLPMISQLLSYLSGKSSQVQVYFDLSPLAEKLSASQNEVVRAYASQLGAAGQVLNNSNFSQSIMEDASIQQARSMFSSANGLNAILFVLAIVELALVFFLSDDYCSGVAKCAGIVFSTGVWSAIGALSMAFLTPNLISSMMGQLMQSREGIAPIATTVGAVIGDVFYEIGMLAFLVSLPLIVAGGGVLAYFRFACGQQQKK